MRRRRGWMLIASLSQAGGRDVRSRPAGSTSGQRHRSNAGIRKEQAMKFMILTYGSQQDYDGMAGKTGNRTTWSHDEFIATASFMRQVASELQESGELVETRGLSAPVHARRIKMREGVPVVTDGPYAESQEV